MICSDSSQSSVSQWREKSLYYPLESLPSHLGGAAKPHTGPSGQDALHMSSTGLYKGLAAQSVFFFFFLFQTPDEMELLLGLLIMDVVLLSRDVQA